VCLRTGATSQAVAECVACGAVTSNQVAAACGVGSDCGGCRRTVRAIIARSVALDGTSL
jgi:bacterioferritin-associated ferredoxin